MLKKGRRTAIVRLAPDDRGREMNRSIDFCRRFGIGAALAVALAMAPAPVSATARVSGKAEDVTVEAQDSPIEEILALLNRDFNVQYRVPVNLNARVTGTYKGSLVEVVRSLLEGRNFVLQSNPGGLAVTVFGVANGATAQPNIAASQPVPQPAPPFSRPPNVSSHAPALAPGTRTQNRY